mgnify:FL=1|tara:strand:+ start:126 stop:770 length:645 start_codon:yes stop_codon:yes gene_type:complete
MKNKEKMPNEIPIFPLSNFIIFPETAVPLNIFEPRYLQMINDSMKSNKLIGMVQPKKTGKLNKPDLYDVGCVGKITSFNETNDGRYLIVINGINRFKIIEEILTEKLYRICKISYENFSNDIIEKKENINFSDLELIFKNLKSIFEKKGFIINWSELKNQNLSQTINTLSMISPFSLEEKQILLESINIKSRKHKLEEILKTYITDEFQNTTLQ